MNKHKYIYKDTRTLSKTGGGAAQIVMTVIASNINEADAEYEAKHGKLKGQKTIVVSVG